MGRVYSVLIHKAAILDCELGWEPKSLAVEF